jgi:hypothetical protein
VAGTGEYLKQIQASERRANKLRDSALYRESRPKFDVAAREHSKDVLAAHNSRTINDEICEIESDAQRFSKRRCHGEVKVRYIHTCRACRADLPHGCPDRHFEFDSPLNGKHYVEDRFLCPTCGSDPWLYAGSDTFNLIEFKPYWEVSLGKDAKCPPGVHYVKGKGHFIDAPEKLRALASMNGRDYR